MPKIPHILERRHGSQLVERRVLRCSRHDARNRLVVRATEARDRASKGSLRQLEVERVRVDPHSSNDGAGKVTGRREGENPRRGRAREHDSTLALTEENRAVGNVGPAGEIDLCLGDESPPSKSARGKRKSKA